MKLINFRISNYKSISNSGEVDIKDFTVLVGKNESGKTNILRALHKFKNVTGERYTKLRDYPRTRYHEYDENDDVVCVLFELTEKERLDLQTKFEMPEVYYIQFTRKYSYFLDVEFHGKDKEPLIAISGEKLIKSVNNFRSVVERLTLSSQPESNSEEITTQLAKLKKELVDCAEGIIEGIEKNTEIFGKSDRFNLKTRIQKLSNLIQKYKNAEAGNLLNSKLDDINQFQNIINESYSYIFDLIPIFIYFESYAMLDSRIHLPNFAQRKKSGTLNSSDKTANTMFELTKLDIERVVELGKIMTPDFPGNSEQYRQKLAEYTVNNQKKIREASDERTILVDRASLSLSSQLRTIWRQRENNPSFDLDGDFLRLWVTDEVSHAKIELEERSKGFQWFLSFFIVFMVESELGHKNSILLLDEPGLNLHASAQQDLIEVLQGLSQKNQLIYTTHSPFMIDTGDLNSIHVVTVDSNEGSVLSNTIWPTDSDAIFPLQSALGYSASQSLFLGKNILLVEGMTDYWILSPLSSYLKDNGKIGLDDELVITPAGGAQKIAYLTSMMVSQKLNVTILADYDGAGKKLFDELVKTKILKDKHLVFVNECLSTSPPQDMDIEDLFPEDYYLNFVNSAYSQELKGKQIDSLSSKHPKIVKRVEEELQKYKIVFHKTRPTRLMLDEFSNPSSPIPSDLLDRFETLFKIINKRRPK